MNITVRVRPVYHGLARKLYQNVISAGGTALQQSDPQILDHRRPDIIANVER